MLDRYINYNKAIEKMVADSEDNKAMLQSLEQQYAELCAEDIKSINYDKDIVQSTPAGDEMANRMMRKQDLAEKINSLRKELKIYNRAWNRLSEKEQRILTEFFSVGYEKRIDAVNTLCDYYEIEKTKVYEMKSAAVRRLKFLMFG
jgi:Mn-dependent DtxR family transcriptional regulator